MTPRSLSSDHLSPGHLSTDHLSPGHLSPDDLSSDHLTTPHLPPGQTAEPDYLYDTEAKRGKLEKSFTAIGSSVCLGAALGGTYGEK